MTIHDRIKQLRNDYRLTQEQVAAYLAIERSTYAGYESSAHGRIPKWSVLKQIAKMYKMTLETDGVDGPLDNDETSSPFVILAPRPMGRPNSGATVEEYRLWLNELLEQCHQITSSEDRSAMLSFAKWIVFSQRRKGPS